MIFRNILRIITCTLLIASADMANAGALKPKVTGGYTMVDGNGYPNPAGFLDPTLTVCKWNKRGCKQMRANQCKSIEPTYVMVYYKDVNVLQRDGEMYPVPHLCSATAWTCNPKVIQALVGVLVGTALAVSPLGVVGGGAGIVVAASLGAAAATSVSDNVEDFIIDQLGCFEIPKGIGPPPFCHNFKRFPLIRVVPVQEKSFPDDPEDIDLSSVFKPKIRVVFDNNFKHCPDGSQVSKDSSCPITCAAKENDKLKRKLYSWSCPSGYQLNAAGSACHSISDPENIAPWSSICPSGYEFDGGVTFFEGDSLYGIEEDDTAHNLEASYDESLTHKVHELEFTTYIKDEQVCADYVNPKLQTTVSTCYPLPRLERPEITWTEGATINNPSLTVKLNGLEESFDVALNSPVEVFRGIEARLVRPSVDETREFILGVDCGDNNVDVISGFSECSNGGEPKDLVAQDFANSNVACIQGLTQNSNEYLLKRDGNHYYMRGIEESYSTAVRHAGVPPSLTLSELRQSELDSIQLVMGGKLRLTLADQDIEYEESEYAIALYAEDRLPAGMEVLGSITLDSGDVLKLVPTNFVKKDGTPVALTRSEKENATSGTSYIPMDLYSQGMCVNYDTFDKPFNLLRDFVTPGEDSLILNSGQRCDFYTFEAWGAGASGVIDLPNVEGQLPEAIERRHGLSFSGGAGGYAKGTVRLDLSNQKLLKVRVGEGGNDDNQNAGGDSIVEICDVSGSNCKMVLRAIGGKSFRQGGVGVVGSHPLYMIWEELYDFNSVAIAEKNMMRRISAEFGGVGYNYRNHDVKYYVPGHPSVVSSLLSVFSPEEADALKIYQELQVELEALESKTWDDVYEYIIKHPHYNNNRNKAYADGQRLDGNLVEWLWAENPRHIKTWGIDWWTLDRIRRAHFDQIAELKNKLGGVGAENIWGDVLYGQIFSGYEGDYEGSRDESNVPLVAKSYLGSKQAAGYLDEEYNPCLDNSYGSGTVIPGFDNNTTPGYGGCANRERQVKSKGTHGKIKVSCEKWVR